jgi:hypothetical protein
MRATNIPWQQNSMRNGYLISNGQYRERFKPSGTDWRRLFDPLTADTRFGGLGERELRNLHSRASRQTTGAFEAPNSKYVSMTSSNADTSWGEGSNITIVFKFDIWRSDVWKGKHNWTRDPDLNFWRAAHIDNQPPAQQTAMLLEQTPPDWDRGAEFEWLALGGTKIHNVRESVNGKTWKRSESTGTDVVFWWESL